MSPPESKLCGILRRLYFESTESLCVSTDQFTIPVRDDSSAKYLLRLLILILAFFLSSVEASSQPLVDASVHADWLQGDDVYGMGGSAHFVFNRYALELVPSGAHYFAENDSTESWSLGLGGRFNLPTLGAIRPYVGTGFVRLRQNDGSEWLLNLSGGIYARVRGDRIVPFIEGAYRPADSLNPWRFRSGLRFVLRER